MEFKARDTDASAGQSSRQIVLSARSLSAGYRAAPHPLQIEDIQLSVAPGELVAIIGPNGSGKSTLLRALSRTLPPRQGAVLLGDTDLYAALSPRESARAIAVVPQSPDVFLDFTVRDIVAMGRAPHRAARGPLAADTPADESAVADALERASIDAELAAKPISQVSGGERQRALIARSLAQESPVLLLDEPVSALDPRHQRHLLGWLKQLAARHNRTVVAVLHDLNAAAEFADRIIVLSDGKIVADGAAAAVLTSDTLYQVYGVRVWIRSNPATGRVCVLPAEALSADDELAELAQDGTTLMGRGQLELRGRRVHLFCGGGSGARVMFALARLGVAVSACALHEGDADLDAARSLPAPHVSAPAFSGPGQEATRRAQALARESEAAVFTALERGEINGESFQQAADFAESGRTLICLGEASWKALRDAMPMIGAFAPPFIAEDSQAVVALLRQVLTPLPEQQDHADDTAGNRAG